MTRTSQFARARVGAIGQDAAAGPGLRRDHGGHYMSRAFRREIGWLGLTFIRAPEGNGCTDRVIRTLNDALLRDRTFETVQELRQALLRLRETDSEHWLTERHGHRSPARSRRDQLDSQSVAALAQTGVSRPGGGAI